MGQRYENVLRLILIVLLLFFIASAMRVKEDYLTGNFMGLGVTPADKPDVNIGASSAYRYGCYDSDGGDNVLAKGYVTYRSGRQLINQFDSCEDGKTLLEWTCLGGGKYSSIGSSSIVVNRECTSGCMNGACLGEKFLGGQDYTYYPDHL